MDYNSYSYEIRANMVETARQKILENGTLSHFVKSASREHLSQYLEATGDGAIDRAVNEAAAKHRVDTEEILDEARASIKFRLLAGLIQMPIAYTPEPWGGLCGHQKYDPESGGWPCKVSGNQDQADSWHIAYGNSPACPFWENPNPEEKASNQLDELMSEGNDIHEAWRKLKLTSPSEHS